MKSKLFPSLLASLALPALAACGSLDEAPGDPSVLATMNGTLSVASGAQAPSSVRVALVWRNEGEDKSQPRFNVAEDLPVAPQFPARFQLSLTSPPPAAALFVPDDHIDMPIAVGSVVAYEDKNRNQRLDLVPAEATSFVDGIVGANDELLVVWLPRAPTPKLAAELRDPQGALPHAGYNLYRVHLSRCTGLDIVPTPGAPVTPCNDPEDIRWLPIDAPFDLPIVTDAKFNKLMCSTRESAGGDSPPRVSSPPPAGAGGQPTYPAPGAKGLVCADDGKSFTYTVCEDESLCSNVGSCAGYGAQLPPGPVPSDWPCTVR